MFAKHGCGAIFFEVARFRGNVSGHAHIQVVPIPNELKDGVEEAFVGEGRTKGILFEEDAERAVQIISDGRTGYFSVELPDGKRLIHLMRSDVPFSVQFGR
jgi:hypothetical protein